MRSGSPGARSAPRTRPPCAAGGACRPLTARAASRRLTREFAAWHGLVVSGGPFAGLAYPDLEATSLIPKLLGAYERELHAAIEAAIRAGPELIVNVGAADGYYAVGLARRCPAAAVHAFEADAAQRALLARVAAANGVERADRRRSHATWAPLPERTLLVMDCEGCEADSAHARPTSGLRRSSSSCTTSPRPATRSSRASRTPTTSR